MRKLVLFDIDGTLLWTDGAGRRAITEALLVEMGTAGPIDGYHFGGKTDPQIVRELMTAAGHPHAESPVHLQAVCARYVGLLARELEAHAEAVRVYEGVPELLDAIEARGDGLLGLLTGNLAAGADLKLRAAGLDPARFRVGAFGSDAADRPDLPPIAVRRAAALFGREAAGQDVVIIGDTPADMTCGRAVGARAIGVATGSYSREQLMEAGGYRAFASLRDVKAVLDAIYA
ncbi:MAG TPA: haloacid dehalogenase-like hydrolase [Gemmatimonadales bacterium]|nr:haloacid dehalogenase-like hydrolase [Gemmatimonadales bacterium]